MSVEENKAFVYKMIEALNGPDWETAVALFFPNPAEYEDFKTGHVQFRKSFPDYHNTIEKIVAEGDRVAVLYKVRGTHSAEFPVADLKGIPATFKPLEWTEIMFIQIIDGKLGPVDFFVDSYSRLQQLGVLK